MTNQPTTLKQLSVKYDSVKADLLQGYAFATRRKTAEILRAALDEYFDKHETTIRKRQV